MQTQHDVKRLLVLDPYAGIDWERVGRHKAALHLHTLQSDGYQMVEEVVRTYLRHGFTVLAVTDHDWNRPNARIEWKHLPPEVASPYPKEPRPANYPANPTWPWTDYGCPGPEELGLIGIQGNELTFRHHINSFFCDYGVWYERTGPGAPYGGIVDAEGREISEDDQIRGIRSRNGLAVVNHPGIDDKYAWWDRKPLDWYVERFRNHPAGGLVGIEVTNCESRYSPYDEGVWDQLLARYMPWRPIWGFGADDMHKLEESRQSFTTFFLDEPSTAGVRRAMLAGRFCFSSSTQGANYRDESFRMAEFPLLKAVKVNPEKGTIALRVENCDEVRWISSPESLEPTADFRTSDSPWPQGRVVHTGLSLNYRRTPDIGRYVRAELVRTEGEHIHRTFTNPFGFTAG
ncbi:MAG: hypothetical protein RBU25_10435 [Lentisphaeria bacterium]|jgi:hypothetical protein|nr:hypothetical protein [Lentisphaeria bacterium]